MPECDHCLLEVSESRAIFDTIDDEEKVFCCNGCRGIARLINEEGLEDFYSRRNSTWIPGPPEDKSVDLSAFAGAIQQRDNETEADIILNGIRCASCIWLIEKILLKTEGVTYAKVNYATHRAKIRWYSEIADIGRIVERIESVGYTPKPFVAKAHEEQLKKEKRDLLIRFGTAAFFSMQLMMYSIALYAGYFQGISPGMRSVLQLVSLFLATPVLFYCGMPFIRGSVRGLQNMAFNMDVLIVTGAGSAYIYSIYQIISGGEVYFDTSSMIITLILLGRYIETGAKGRASEVITRLLSLNPGEAKVIRGQGSGVRGKGAELLPPGHTLETVQVSSIQKNDLVQVAPGGRIPLDGIIVDGSSEVDESMLTGESRPVSKRAGSEVLSGTQNLLGSFIFKVQRTGEDTVLSQIIKTVEDAQAKRAPVQALVDRVVGLFVPAVLLLSAGAFISWYYYGRDGTQALMNAVSVLVIACPCALGLATPLAILTGTTRGASKGILIKGGDIIERVNLNNTVVLDKTGTITEGKQELVAFKGIEMPGDKALCIAASLERLSEHTIARAIVHGHEKMSMYNVTDFTASVGKGVTGKVDGKEVFLGSRSYIESEGMVNNLESVLNSELLLWVQSQERSGATVVYLSLEKKLSGIFAISDRVREEAREAIERLKNMGSDVMMITGDSKYAAEAVAGIVNLDNDKVMSQRSPVEKAAHIEKMQKEGRNVAMAGDGINDAPALVQANVGIAMGRATDIALESADIVLLRSDLRLISDAIILSRRIYRIIKQNLFWAFIYNVVALPLAVTGILHPIVAAIAMTFSSLSVVGNSMRLKRG